MERERDCYTVSKANLRAAAILSEEGYGMQNYTSYLSFMGG
jgi:hypothetical protein